MRGRARARSPPRSVPARRWRSPQPGGAEPRVATSVTAAASVPGHRLRSAAAAILLFAAAIRLASWRVNQSLWPDEAVYLLAAKSFAGLADYELPAARPVLLPLLWSLFFRAGLGEPAIRLTGIAFS